ncbi:hypothetical protein [Flavobacterium sp.]|uniref:hypothetical protein n=1 Tax=Flavobacterium sp. TaxID=239 RepID=UPI0040337C5C
MKKIFLLLSIVSTFALTSCNVDDDRPDNDTISEMFHVDNVNFVASGQYRALVPLNPAIYSSDVILVYRWAGVNSLNHDIWEPVPNTYNLDEGKLSFFFDFSVDDVVLYLESEFDPMLRQDFSLNQSFRIVIVPAYDNSARMNMSYDSVVARYGLKEKDVKHIKL